MNKQKTYTVEELFSVFGSKEFQAFLTGTPVQEDTEEIKPCIRCDMGGSEHPHVEEIKLLNPKEPSSRTDVYEYIDYKIAKKVDELIRSHNTLLKQMKGRPV